MAASDEVTIWKETPLKTHWWLACLLILPIPYALWKILQLSNHTYELTTQRLRTRTGIFSKRTDDLELYRVKDISMAEPFFLRMFSSGNLVLDTTDTSTPLVHIAAIRNPDQRRADLRKYVEQARSRRGARTVEVD